MIEEMKPVEDKLLYVDFKNKKDEVIGRFIIGEEFLDFQGDQTESVKAFVTEAKALWQAQTL